MVRRVLVFSLLSILLFPMASSLHIHVSNSLVFNPPSFPHNRMSQVRYGILLFNLLCSLRSLVQRLQRIMLPKQSGVHLHSCSSLVLLLLAMELSSWDDLGIQVFLILCFCLPLGPWCYLHLASRRGRMRRKAHAFRKRINFNLHRCH